VAILNVINHATELQDFSFQRMLRLVAADAQSDDEVLLVLYLLGSRRKN
jgi:hypothetical protein